MAVALPDFAYRAAMDDGTVEHELCPVVVAEVKGAPVPSPARSTTSSGAVGRARRARGRRGPGDLSPWSVEQVAPARRAGAVAGASGSASERADAGRRPCSTVRRLDIGRVGSTRRSAGRPGPTDAARRSGPARWSELLAGSSAAQVASMSAIDPVLARGHRRDPGLVDAGGKRLRPAFVLLGPSGHRVRPPDDAVLRPAAAVELLHTFALLHDDVMDRSAIRRGRPDARTPPSPTATGAAAGGGDADWFGASAAILAGDLAFVWADELLRPRAAAADAVARARAGVHDPARRR